MWLLYLDLITRISFIFSLIMAAVIIMYNPVVPFYFFPLLIFLSFMAHILKNFLSEKLRFFVLIPYISIIFLPLGTYEKILILLISLISTYLLLTQKSVSYGLAVDHYRKTSPIAIIIFIISFFMRYLSTSRFTNFELTVLPSLLVYFVVSVFLLRTLRYMEHKIEDKKLVSLNLRYAFGVISLSALLSIPGVRDKIFFITSNIFSIVYFLFTTIIAVIFIVIGYILSWIFYLVLNFMAKRGLIGSLNTRDFRMDPNLSRLLRLLWDRRESHSEIIDILLVISFYILVTGLIILIILWVIRRVFSSQTKGENYIEEREFLFSQINPWNAIRRFLEGRNLGIVREYYRKYLMRSKNLGVDLKPSDTTQDVYKKTFQLFDSEVLRRIREIYIYVRYNRMESSRDLDKEFISLYRRLFKK
ncbi:MULTISPECIES: hypothetical protein [Dictyoglomus]|uniref:DUF4129 domain-containing protein n=1 Tax=Dictyoglomus turgidum (strain DSM 6724 / Z-1310) TaxID=515635 RepID=B8DZQ8_DICTD|nr:MULTISPECIES: hypothetical protein [Dictyoglomus]ACK41991.1 conserved hypothetical protein [Dictyoglomus turgidum DSM 6724]HBU31449.1 hypothetical protein [Dictyoglomus sp.]